MKYGIVPSSFMGITKVFDPEVNLILLEACLQQKADMNNTSMVEDVWNDINKRGKRYRNTLLKAYEARVSSNI